MSHIREVKLETEGYRPSRIMVIIEYQFQIKDNADSIIIQKFPRSKFWLYNGGEYIFDDLLIALPNEVSQEILYSLDEFRQEP